MATVFNPHHLTTLTNANLAAILTELEGITGPVPAAYKRLKKVDLIGRIDTAQRSEAGQCRLIEGKQQEVMDAYDALIKARPDFLPSHAR